MVTCNPDPDCHEASTESTAATKGLKVAVKYINLDKASEAYRLKFFPKELKATLYFKNKYVVRLYDVLRTGSEPGGEVFIVMELAKSDLLKEITDKSPGVIAEAQAKSWMRHVTKGIAYLHSQQWAHRDLKVENVLISFHHKRAMISDFGFVRQIERK